ncbi:hypothetical protein J4Q44_G00014710 [Coregonus suidteri]|uniref:Uncharacterized protein n=1 Tax=Coregonus suidteri TaxID=861788 RepID=A0AAN8R9U2_9TELE
MGSTPEQIKKEFGEARGIGEIEKLVSKYRNRKVTLEEPRSYELRIGGLEDTVHAGDNELLEVWENLYLPETMAMVVIGALDDFPCSASRWQLVLLYCEDGNIYAYEFEVLHLVAKSLKDLFESGAKFPGWDTFKFGECLNMTPEELAEMMQSKDIKQIEAENAKYQSSILTEMIEDSIAFTQWEQPESTIQCDERTQGNTSMKDNVWNNQTPTPAISLRCNYDMPICTQSQRQLCFLTE